MRISVNLATRPFIELRPFFLRLRLLMLGLGVLCVGAAMAAHWQQIRVDRAELQLEELRNRTVASQRGKLRSEARMREPANASVLDRAHFLNALFLAKSFSWTAVMMDLENVLPTGVQVTSIEPQVAADGDVVIRLRVAGDRDRAVQLVRNLERSRRFLAPRLSGESAQAREAGLAGVSSGSGSGAVGFGGSGNGGSGNGRSGSGGSGNAGSGIGGAGNVEFEILADYNPLPVLAGTGQAAGTTAAPQGGAK